MNETSTAFPNTLRATSLRSSEARSGIAQESTPMAFALELASADALLSVLTMVARLGCRTLHVFATERQAALGVLAPRRVAHRLLPCLQGLIDVLAIVEAPAVLPLAS
jgi:hypothetical protein